MSDTTRQNRRDDAAGAAPGGDPSGADASSAVPGNEATAAAAIGGDLGRPASLASDAWRQLRARSLFWMSAGFISFMVLVAVFPQIVARRDPYACDLSRSVQGPSAGHWFGFDIQGCDYFTRVMYGARPSIAIGILVTSMSVLVAVVLGSLAGYYGRWVDTVISRMADIFLGIPFLVGAIVFLNAFERRGVIVVALALTVLGWMTLTRLMRSAVIQARDMDYVSAA